LTEVLKKLPQTKHPDLLVGFNKADDAAVFRISENQALVQTVDFFPPIVDDPYDFGRIAAANALSDVFAMGGRPLTALNIVGFPVGEMAPDILTEILRGGSEKIEEAGAFIVGGHSIKDKELKYGVAVTGLINPARILTNAGAQPGDILFLTKPLGTGLITTAIKKNAVDGDPVNAAIAQMTALNSKAAELMLSHDAHAATDITGYGLLGHAYEMACASDVTIRVFPNRLPLLQQALELAIPEMVPGGGRNNRDYLDGKVHFTDKTDERYRIVLFDPQTSGGLLIAVPEDRAGGFQRALKDNGLPDRQIGQVEPRNEYPIMVA